MPSLPPNGRRYNWRSPPSADSLSCTTSQLSIYTAAESVGLMPEIELTESVAFGDPAIFPTLEALRQVGMRFAADDFGMGYSCLQHLKCCPITTLKIDQSFVAALVALFFA